MKITREEIEHLLNQLNDFANSGFEDQKNFNEALAALANLSLMKETETPKPNEKIDQQDEMFCGNCMFYCPKGDET